MSPSSSNRYCTLFRHHLYQLNSQLYYKHNTFFAEHYIVCSHLLFMSSFIRNSVQASPAFPSPHRATSRRHGSAPKTEKRLPYQTSLLFGGSTGLSAEAVHRNDATIWVDKEAGPGSQSIAEIEDRLVHGMRRNYQELPPIDEDDDDLYLPPLSSFEDVGFDYIEAPEVVPVSVPTSPRVRSFSPAVKNAAMMSPRSPSFLSSPGLGSCFNMARKGATSIHSYRPGVRVF
ncbi:hypothetical protein Hypma_008602 [Hypsizygus marmoreus]|uniref:Uncharacterized protein n=1 Tax=Hypsizygus marmoreus TaxID=39966 RepID=A0A369JX35_HYPMA|nr:hypothetical protein Hypma_008602 [Hypsizygus marmoreus]